MDHFMKYHVESHIEDLRRDARRAGMGRPTARSGPRRMDPATPITIRFATGADAAGLRRLAQLDSASVPVAPVLLAMVDGDVRAAVSLADRAVVADPFHNTAAIVELLKAYAAHERANRGWGAGERLRRVFISRSRRAGKKGQRKPALESR